MPKNRQPQPETPSLYPCRVLHHRLRPKKHRFHYRFFLLHLDLDHLQSAAKNIPWFSINRPNLISFQEKDYLEGDNTPLKPRLLAQLKKLGWELPADTRVTLLTLPRLLGYVFHPVSFYYLRDNQDQPLGAAAEVGNTYGEHKLYPIPAQSPQENRHKKTHKKDYYISPFSPLDIDIDFRLSRPTDTLKIDIHEHDQDGPLLLTHTQGQRQELTKWTLLGKFLKNPLMTLRIITDIHAHALILALKKLPITPKRKNQAHQTGILRPHDKTFPNQNPPASTAQHTP